MCQLQLQSGPNVFAEFRSEKSGGKNHEWRPNPILLKAVMAMAICTGYFYGIVHSINGVLLVLITGKGP